jgi:hypothetical protein
MIELSELFRLSVNRHLFGKQRPFPKNRDLFCKNRDLSTKQRPFQQSRDLQTLSRNHVFNFRVANLFMINEIAIKDPFSKSCLSLFIILGYPNC